MSNKTPKDLDEALFELCYDDDDPYPPVIDPPITNKRFLINACIGLACYILIPFIIIAVTYFLGH